MSQIRWHTRDASAFLSLLKEPEKFAADVAELRRIMRYCPDTGALFWNKEAGFRGPVKHGAEAGVINRAIGGYRIVCINYTHFRGHCLVWVYVHGEWPVGQIDHINGNRADNRIENLRVVSNRTNAQNQRKPRADNTTGYLGVSLDKRRGKFGARIRVPNGKYLFLGNFDAPEAAHAAYLNAKRKLHEGCTL